MMDLSVVICTHGPKRALIARVLEALKVQSLDPARWELLLVDNGSDPALSDIDLSWHRGARYIREDELGLTPARLRGIGESTGAIVVFVDDDNILAEDYLEQAIAIGRDYPLLGTWGGDVRGEFEAAPEDWVKPYFGWLAVREELPAAIWSNDPYNARSHPFGAGMCLRRDVAKKYAEIVATDPRRRALDRQGKNFLSCGDTDIVLTGHDCGYGSGVFPQLRMLHVIPPVRLSREYLVKLAHGLSYSGTRLALLRGYQTPSTKPYWKRVLQRARIRIGSGPLVARMHWQSEQGVQDAIDGGGPL